MNNGASVQSLFGYPPTNGPDAIVQGGWYHVAVAYDGNQATPNNFKFYWTLLDPSRTQASLISAQQMTPRRVQISLKISREYRAKLPQRIRIIAEDLGEAELFCIRSSTRPQIDHKVTQSNPERIQP